MAAKKPIEITINTAVEARTMVEVLPMPCESLVKRADEWLNFWPASLAALAAWLATSAASSTVDDKLTNCWLNKALVASSTSTVMGCGAAAGVATGSGGVVATGSVAGATKSLGVNALLSAGLSTVVAFSAGASASLGVLSVISVFLWCGERLPCRVAMKRIWPATGPCAQPNHRPAPPQLPWLMP